MESVLYGFFSDRTNDSVIVVYALSLLFFFVWGGFLFSNRLEEWDRGKRIIIFVD